MLHRRDYNLEARSHGESEKFEIACKHFRNSTHTHIPQGESVIVRVRVGVWVRVAGCVWSLMRPLTFFKQEI